MKMGHCMNFIWWAICRRQRNPNDNINLNQSWLKFFIVNALSEKFTDLSWREYTPHS